MANFPTSAPSFAAKTPGQKIASAHINAIQDEVVAIGAGYLGGTAPITSSRAVMTNISAGSSTFTGLVVTTAISTLTVTLLTPVSINAASTNLVIANIATAVSGTSGGATALPSTPSGYIKVTLNGSTFVIPYFNP